MTLLEMFVIVMYYVWVELVNVGPMTNWSPIFQSEQFVTEIVVFVL